MRRREFVAGLCARQAGLVWSWTAAKNSAHRFSGIDVPASHAGLLDAYRRGLRDLGYVESETVSTAGRRANATAYPACPRSHSKERRSRRDMRIRGRARGQAHDQRCRSCRLPLAILPEPASSSISLGANITGLCLLATGQRQAAEAELYTDQDGSELEQDCPLAVDGSPNRVQRTRPGETDGAGELPGSALRDFCSIATFPTD